MNNVVTLEPTRALDYTGKQVDLIRNTVAADCNDSEFNLFIEVCKRVGLDPFRKQIYAVVYSKNNVNKRKMSIITGIDGFRAVAARNGDYRPDDDEAVFTTDESLKDPDTNPHGFLKCTVKAYKLGTDGQWYKVSGTAYWNEFAPLVEKWAYNKEAGKDRPTGEFSLDKKSNWFRMPHVMLAKCAESQALRKGWPEDLSAIYSPEEMAQAAAQDLSATEAVEEYQANLRLKAVSAVNAITMDMQDGDAAGLQQVPIGRFADAVLERVKAMNDASELDFFLEYNKTGLQEFWARHKADALTLKKEIEQVKAALAAKA